MKYTIFEIICELKCHIVTVLQQYNSSYTPAKGADQISRCSSAYRREWGSGWTWGSWMEALSWISLSCVYRSNASWAAARTSSPSPPGYLAPRACCAGRTSRCTGGRGFVRDKRPAINQQRLSCFRWGYDACLGIDIWPLGRNQWCNKQAICQANLV